MPVYQVKEPSLHVYSQEEEKDQCCLKARQTFAIFVKYVLLRVLVLTIYVLDILSDINVAYGDYKAGDELFAYVTLGLVFAPGVLFSIYLFFDYLFTYIGEIACLKAPLSLLVSPFMPFWVILRDVRLIIVGLIATFCPKKREKMVKRLMRPSRVYLLKFLEAFTEAAPQLLVRLFRVASRSNRPFSDLRTSEIIQISFSLLTLSMKVVTTHQQSVSTQQIIDGEVEMDSRYSLPWYLQIVAIIWWLCYLISRFEALALFTSSYGFWVLLAVGIHILLVFLFQTLADRKDRLKRIFIYLFGAFVFIFAYVQFNLKTRVKIAAWFPYLIFAIVLFVENSILLTFWFFHQLNNLQLIALTTMNPINATIESTTSIPYISSVNATIVEPFSDISLQELQCHWKILLYLHYGVFGAGTLLMTLVFWGASICSRDETSAEEKRNDTDSHMTAELQTLMHS